MSASLITSVRRRAVVFVAVVVAAWLAIPALPAFAGNAPPELAPIGPQEVAEGSQLWFRAQATDLDLGDVLTYELRGTIPPGATINASTGVFTWTPTEAQGPLAYPIDVVVRDNGVPQLEDAETITITVTEVNRAPVLAQIPRQVVAVGATLSFTLRDYASDPDLPPNTLEFSLWGVPGNVAFDTATGAFSWSPIATQVGTWTFRAGVSDGTLSSSRPFTIEVSDGNRPPVISLGTTSPTSLAWGESLEFRASATDPDEDSTGLHFTLVGAPTGATMTPWGSFRWIPSSTQIRRYTFTVMVTDNGSPQLSDQVGLTVDVQRRLAVLDYSVGGYGSHVEFSDEMECYGYLRDASAGSLHGAGIMNASIRFEFGGAAAVATTDARGTAETGFLVQERAGSRAMLMSFAGNALYQPAAYVGAVRVEREHARLRYTGDVWVRAGWPATVRLSARISERLDGALGYRIDEQRFLFEVYRSGRLIRTGSVAVTGVSASSAVGSLTRALRPGRYHVVTWLAPNPYYVAEAVRSVLVVG